MSLNDLLLAFLPGQEFPAPLSWRYYESWIQRLHLVLQSPDHLIPPFDRDQPELTLFEDLFYLIFWSFRTKRWLFLHDYSSLIPFQFSNILPLLQREILVWNKDHPISSLRHCPVDLIYLFSYKLPLPGSINPFLHNNWQFYGTLPMPCLSDSISNTSRW